MNKKSDKKFSRSKARKISIINIGTEINEGGYRIHQKNIIAKNFR